MPDIINAIFEFLAAWFLILDVRAIRRDKAVQGFSPLSATFFAVWTGWSTLYYYLLDQHVSCAIALVCLGINIVWLTTVYRFQNRGHG